MFCESCGKEIRNTNAFCPFCGNKTNGLKWDGSKETQNTLNFKFDNMSAVTGTKEAYIKKKASSASSKKTLPVIAIVIFAVLFLGGLSVFLLGNTRKEYSIEGEWKSDDLDVLPEIVREYVQNEGYPIEIADILIEMLMLDDIGKNVTIAFTEDNKILLIVNGVTLGSDLLSYQKVGDGKLLLQFEWKGSILGTSIPLSFGYTGEYEVKKTSLSIDFFGYDIRMTRQQGEE